MIVVGIDVGGERRGFHAAALQGGRYLQRMISCDVDAIAFWCQKLGWMRNGARLYAAIKRHWRLFDGKR